METGLPAGAPTPSPTPAVGRAGATPDWLSHKAPWLSVPAGMLRALAPRPKTRARGFGPQFPGAKWGLASSRHAPGSWRGPSPQPRSRSVATTHLPSGVAARAPAGNAAAPHQRALPGRSGRRRHVASIAGRSPPAGRQWRRGLCDTHRETGGEGGVAGLQIQLIQLKISASKSSLGLT